MVEASTPVINSGSTINGYTYTQLGDQWWSNVIAVATDRNPLAFDDHSDPRGKRGSVEKASEVQSTEGIFFLVGRLNPSNTPPPVVRSVVVPADAVLFFPLANRIGDNTTPSVEDFGGFPLTATQLEELEGQSIPNLQTTPLIDLLEPLVDEISGFFTNVNGETLNLNFADFKQLTAAAPWTQLPRYFAPEDNLVDLTGDLILADPNVYLEAGLYPTLDEQGVWSDQGDGPPWEVPFVQGGYYLAMNPLGAGAHQLQFGATSRNQDTTYTLLNPVLGTDDSDKLVGTKDSDYLAGDYRADQLSGLRGDDLILGGNGGDRIDGGLGDDELWGDQGADTFLFKPRSGHDTLYDFEVGDKIILRGLLVPSGDIPTVTLGSGLTAAQIDFGGGEQLTLVGIAPDRLLINAGVITLAS